MVKNTLAMKKHCDKLSRRRKPPTEGGLRRRNNSHLSGPILHRVRIDSPEHADRKGRVPQVSLRARHPIEGVVRVRGLFCFSRVQVNRQERGDLIMRCEHTVGEG